MQGPLVSICFDDGRLTAAHEGAQILEKHGLRGTYYPIVGKIGTSNEHGAYCSWEDLRRLEKVGHEIGNHTYSHDRSWVEWPLEKQRQDISSATGTMYMPGALYPPKTFAYPFGLYNDKLKKLVMETDLPGDFIAARTVDRGINSRHTDPFLLKSFALENTHSLNDVAKDLDETIQANGWLILTFHHIDDKTFISTPPELFERIILLILEKKVSIVPVRKGAEEYLRK